MPANLENSAVATGLEKVSFHSNPKERQCQRMLKLLHNCTHLTSKVMLKILQARLQQYVNHELPGVQAGFRKGKESEIQLPTSVQSSEKQEFQKNISASLTMLKPLTVWITTNCGKFFKRWEYQTLLPASWEICMQVKKQQSELDATDWFQIGKEVCQGCVLSPCFFNYMQSTSCKMPDWMKHKLESRLLGEISITSDT